MNTAHTDRLALARRAFTALALTALLAGAAASAVPAGAEECNLACQGAPTNYVVTGVADPATADAAAAGSGNDVVLVASADRDGDLLTDVDEATFYGTNPDAYDTDYDGLSDYAELFAYFTNPTLYDTDHDGWGDGDELLMDYHDPLDPADHP